MPKVHITLPKLSGEELTDLLTTLGQDFGLQELNEKRARFMGIATGLMQESEIERLRASGLVTAVSLDQVRVLQVGVDVIPDQILDLFTPEAHKTGFDRYFDKRMADPEFAEAYNKERDSIDAIDTLIRSSTDPQE